VTSLGEAGWRVIVSVVDDRTSIRGVWRNLRRLKKETAAAQPQIVHAQYGTVTAAVARLVKGDLPFIVSFCGDDLLGTPEPGFHWRVREACSRSIGIWAAGQASAIIVKSRNLFDALPQFLKARATILGNGVDTTWFKPINQEQCRSELNWSMQSKVVLFNGGPHEDRACKNPALAAETVSLLRKSFPNARLHMMTNGSRAEVRLAMNAADCLLVTSLHEGSPNIVKEAMACNLPVVAVPCGDVAERLSGTYPGGIAPYEPSALAERIADVFKSNCRSNGCQQLTAQGLTAPQVAQSLMNIYNSVLQGQTQGELTETTPESFIRPRVSGPSPNHKSVTEI
jgi:glycosyltransferase involved in cell wall biosynthesis